MTALIAYSVSYCSTNRIDYVLDTGVPIKLLYEGEGHIVTVELKNGEVYRGLLAEAEDTMNCQLKEGNECFYAAISMIASKIYCNLIFVGNL